MGLTAAPGDVEDVAAKLRAMLEPGTNARLRNAARRAAAGLAWEREQELLATVYEVVAA